MKNLLFLVLVSFSFSCTYAQTDKPNFKIRTITSGITLESLQDTNAVLDAIVFLKNARQQFIRQGYEVQTIRISTQNAFEIQQELTLTECIPYLKILDKIAQRENCMFAIGSILPPDNYNSDISAWATRLIQETKVLSFSLAISSTQGGIYHQSIKAAAEIIVAISKSGAGGEGNFRFTASANIPPGTPFFPAAYHSGPKSFAIGLEYPNVLTEIFTESAPEKVRSNAKLRLEELFRPIEEIGMKLSKSYGWIYDGIDTSPAPGLDASIGTAIETWTSHPFGGPSTLSACSLITDIIKNLDVRTCGYSGLMLPVIEDKVLAQRAAEGRFTVQELLLFSSVSGTGLDVVPLPGNTPSEVIERILLDVASLSLKYTNKALSARLFLIPGKTAGESVNFENPYLTAAKVMKIE